jgi:hypothetical protein
MTVLRMADSIYASDLPSGWDAYAGYVGGSWPDYDPICERFPALHAQGRIVPVAVNASERARILDVENGDASPADAGPWLKWMLSLGVRLPGCYGDEASMSEIRNSIAAAGIDGAEHVLWVAEWNGQPRVPGGYEAHQWLAHGPDWENFDQNACSAEFFAGVLPLPPLPHRNSSHYDWFDTGPRAIAEGRSERFVVQRYDELRAMQTPSDHPHHIELAFRRTQCRSLANRIASVAHDQPRANGRPSWQIDHRGWRRIQLARRSEGQRLA